MLLNGSNILNHSPAQMLAVRKAVQLVFQDPYSSLNPRKTMMEILSRPLKVHGLATTRAEQRSRVLELLRQVGLAEEHADRYPHEFSGGQRQRIAIARALAVNPQLIIGDEPVSALDVSIQAQILNLLRDLQKTYSLTFLFIAHDLSVIRHISDRVAVMYVGKIVEIGHVDAVFDNPQHPYTQALLKAVPEADPNAPPPVLTLEGRAGQSDRPAAGLPLVQALPDCRRSLRSRHARVARHRQRPLRGLPQGADPLGGHRESGPRVAMIPGADHADQREAAAVDCGQTQRTHRMPHTDCFKAEGGCDCNAVRYRMESAPLVVHCCHCRWCQRETGAAFALNAIIESDRVTSLGIEPDVIDTPSASGRGQKIARCPSCKVAVWSNYSGAGPLTRFIRVGTLDNPDLLAPDVHIFTVSKQPWVQIPEGARSFAGFYNREEVWSAGSLERRHALLRPIDAASPGKPV